MLLESTTLLRDSVGRAAAGGWMKECAGQLGGCRARAGGGSDSAARTEMAGFVGPCRCRRKSGPRIVGSSEHGLEMADGLVYLKIGRVCWAWSLVWMGWDVIAVTLFSSGDRWARMHSGSGRSACAVGQ